MNSDVETIARALLYEGITLYPYRNSVLKNQQRFNFGVLLPQPFCEAAKNGDTWFQQTQCLLQAEASARLRICVRFLQLHDHSVLERECRLPETAIKPGTWTQTFCWSGEQEVFAEIRLDCEKVAADLYRVTLRNRNATVMSNPDASLREEALPFGMLAVHSILTVKDGTWISLLDPPPQVQGSAAGCENIGAWPVLAGNSSLQNTMLSSPIILYDYPQIAPESTGDFFDGLEIDELLMLRILTLTDEEKQAMRESDQPAREILARAENLPAEQLLKLHGAWRAQK